jgi:phosphate:Na+ symporter
MVVGFVNSGVMTLKQSIGVIMGANVGTTVTAWILSLGGIGDGVGIFLKLLKPSSFTPILALIGTGLMMFSKSSKKKDIGTILLGFATLMFGMDTMSGAVKGLSAIPEFQQLFVAFKNPILGMLVGAVLTAIIQSSSASVGILQALSATGAVSYGAAIPIIMGQNIGTTVTALISCVGANKNAKRAAIIHFLFNVIGMTVYLSAFWIISEVITIPILNEPAGYLGIAVCHTVFKILCVALLMPMSSLLEKLACKIVRGSDERRTELDERLLATPTIALEQCSILTRKMASEAVEGFRLSMSMIDNYDPEIAKKVRELEDNNDHYEDVLGTYLTKLSSRQVTDQDSLLISKLLKLIGDFERISDHSVNVLESAEELREKGIEFTESAKHELMVLCSAVEEILTLSERSFVENDFAAAFDVEPLEEVIDELRHMLRDSHIVRLRGGECTVEAGFIWSDLLTNLERVADHCSNVAVCIIDAEKHNMDVHASLKDIKKDNARYKKRVNDYFEKYKISTVEV